LWLNQDESNSRRLSNKQIDVVGQFAEDVIWQGLSGGRVKR
jgi:hypothetical protein